MQNLHTRQLRKNPIRTFEKKILDRIYKPLVKWYTGRERPYTFRNIAITVLPGVFHPGWLISTRILLNFIKKYKLEGKSMLELGAGSGLISLFYARNKAIVTASDINPVAVNGLRENALTNGNIPLKVVLSDLFDNIDLQRFDYILINPPYYPKDPVNDKERAFYCGTGFEYFKKLSLQLPAYLDQDTHCRMILSEDCDIKQIQSIIEAEGMTFEEIYRIRKWGEWNYIFALCHYH